RSACAGPRRPVRECGVDLVEDGRIRSVRPGPACRAGRAVTPWAAVTDVPRPSPTDDDSAAQGAARIRGDARTSTPAGRDDGAPGAGALPVVAMIGGGQLARMTQQAAIALGQNLRVLAGAPDESAAQVSADVVLGSHTDLDALRRAAEGAAA